MARWTSIAAVLVLAGCASADGTLQETAPMRPAALNCEDAEAAWQWFLSTEESPRGLVACVDSANTLDPVLTLALAETRKSAKRTAFSRSVSFVRAAALTGNGRAQRALSDLYASKSGWYGRNAYLALFWRGVVGKTDPSYRGRPEVQAKLRFFQETLSPETGRELTNRISAWQPNDPGPPRLTVDSLVTYAIEAKGRATTPTINNIVDYGLASGFADADMMDLIAHGRNLTPQERRARYARQIQKGSFLALIFQISAANQTGAKPEEAVWLVLTLLERIGLDPNSLTAEQFEQADVLAKDPTITSFGAALIGKSKPEQRTVAMLTLIALCGEETTVRCIAAVDELEPLLPPTARLLTRVVRLTQSCPRSRNAQRCYYENNGLGVVRDLFALDYVDVSGRET